MYLCMCGCTHVCTCAWMPEISMGILLTPSTLFFEKSLSLSLLVQLSSLDNELQASARLTPFLPPQLQGNRYIPLFTAFYMGARYLNASGCLVSG